MRFYDMTIPKTALLNQLSDIDSKPVSLSSLLAPIDCIRVLSLCAASSALAKSLQIAQSWVMESRAAPSVMPLEYATTQKVLMRAHTSLVAVHLIRNQLVLQLREKKQSRLSTACAVHFISVCQSQLLALSQCMGADGLLSVTGFQARLQDVQSAKEDVIKRLAIGDETAIAGRIFGVKAEYSHLCSLIQGENEMPHCL